MNEFNTKEKYLKISDINSKIHNSIAKSLGNYNFWIQAEINGMNIAGGHCYMTLLEKESTSTNPKASIKGMIWSKEFPSINKKFSNATGFDLKDNIKILFLAKVNYHILHGLSLSIEDIEPAFTLGELLMQRDAVVKRLRDEGNYSLNKKIKFPIVPQRIAVISAKDSKGYEDFLNKITNNIFKYRFAVTLFPSLLQGDKAAGNMKDQLINIYNNIRNFDVVVIVRGGGGSVNLNCFNDYVLSKGVARFPIPVITGIGHTSNISVVDEVAYLDKITPTDVAHFLIEQTNNYESRVQKKFRSIVNKYSEFKEGKLQSLNFEFTNLINLLNTIKIKRRNGLAEIYTEISHKAELLVREKINDTVSSKKIFVQTANSQLSIKSSQLQNKLETISQNFNSKIRNSKERLSNTLNSLDSHSNNFIRTQLILQKGKEEKIEILDPKNVLKRGYSITLRNGKAITDSKSVNSGDIITTLLLEGELQSKINNIN